VDLRVRTGLGMGGDEREAGQQEQQSGAGTPPAARPHGSPLRGMQYVHTVFTVRRYGHQVPRIADHEQRRRQIAVAVCDLIAEQGFDAVTVARTAAAAGISVGLVQHYFPTKDEMLLHAFAHVSSSIRSRIDERIRAGAEHRRPISRVLAEALAQFLPLDAERRAEYRVSRAFAGRALDSPALAEIDAATARARLDELAQAVRNGKECGEV